MSILLGRRFKVITDHDYSITNTEDRDTNVA